MHLMPLFSQVKLKMLMQMTAREVMMTSKRSLRKFPALAF